MGRTSPTVCARSLVVTTLTRVVLPIAGQPATGHRQPLSRNTFASPRSAPLKGDQCLTQLTSCARNDNIRRISWTLSEKPDGLTQMGERQSISGFGAGQQRPDVAW